MAAAVVTSRPIQNAHTALDLWVPEYQEIRGKMMTGHVEYQIVVVTTLPAFKSAKHKPGDVVQFVVSKKYSEIEEFYHKLCAGYPHASLPPFPRKVLFVGEADIRERRAAFNDIVKAIAKDRQLAACPQLLDFLGSNSTDFVDLKWEKCHVNQSEEGDFFKQEDPSEEALLHLPARSQNRQNLPRTEDNEEEEEEEEEEEVDLDPLGILKAKTKKTKKPTQPKVEDLNLKPSSRLALFDETDPDAGLFEPRKNPSSTTKKPFTGANEIKLFEEQDLGGTVQLGDSLLMQSAFKAKDVFKPSTNEDLDELLRVEEGFEKLLSLEPKSKKKGKPPIPAKPSFTKVSGDSEELTVPPEKREANIEAMDELDILRYITENEQAPSESGSLF
ncbi:HCLS1-binding protein 3 [Xenopus laevis]|uniref:HCLS1-binding protein 3 n=2 Tax=Xenopus laevis TaxID=8355 RepID=A0A1L8G590_XENLA|nr:HCLS1-binding protein 3 [Xenopus laevis]OCT79023.1 hypothetical protein XELAEV_18030119mg [Xenopus laevis]